MTKLVTISFLVGATAPASAFVVTKPQHLVEVTGLKLPSSLVQVTELDQSKTTIIASNTRLCKDNIHQEGSLDATIVAAHDFPTASSHAATGIEKGLAVPGGLLKKNTPGSGRRIKQLGSAGTASHQQRLHSALGLGSLIILGGMHFANIMRHGSFAMPISQGAILSVGLLHMLITAFMGLPRIDWKNKKEAARIAMIWRVPLQNLCLVGACLTEWTQGADAAISMYSTPFAVLTGVNLLVSIWQTSVSYISGGADETERQKSGNWFESAEINMLVTFVTYTAVLAVFFGEVLFASQTEIAVRGARLLVLWRKGWHVALQRLSQPLHLFLLSCGNLLRRRFPSNGPSAMKGQAEKDIEMLGQLPLRGFVPGPPRLQLCAL